MDYCGSLCVVCKVGTLLLTATPAGAEAERGDNHIELSIFKTVSYNLKIFFLNVRLLSER